MHIVADVLRGRVDLVSDASGELTYGLELLCEAQLGLHLAPFGNLRRELLVSRLELPGSRADHYFEFLGPPPGCAVERPLACERVRELQDLCGIEGLLENQKAIAHA